MAEGSGELPLKPEAGFGSRWPTQYEVDGVVYDTTPPDGDDVRRWVRESDNLEPPRSFTGAATIGECPECGTHCWIPSREFYGLPTDAETTGEKGACPVCHRQVVWRFIDA